MGDFKIENLDPGRREEIARQSESTTDIRGSNMKQRVGTPNVLIGDVMETGERQHTKETVVDEIHTPRVPPITIQTPNDFSHSTRSLTVGVRHLTIVGEFLEQLRQDILGEIDQQIRDLENGNAPPPVADPPATETEYWDVRNQFVNDLEKEIMDNVRAGKYKDKEGNPISEKNLLLAGTNITAVSVALQELASVLTDMAGKDAAMAIMQRDQVRDLVLKEMHDILEEGRIKDEMYRKMGALKLTGAIISFTVTVGSVALSSGLSRRTYPTDSKGAGTTEGDKFNRGQQAQQRHMEKQAEMITHSLTDVINKSFEYQSLIEQGYGERESSFKNADRVFIQNMKESMERSRADQLDKSSRAREQRDRLIEALINFSSSAFRVGGIGRQPM